MKCVVRDGNSSKKELFKCKYCERLLHRKGKDFVYLRDGEIFRIFERKGNGKTKVFENCFNQNNHKLA